MEQPKIIDANDRSVRQVLDKIKYTIDVFQREYKWERKHMEQLINDLTIKFLVNYKDTHTREDVANYGKYYLGSIVVCLKDGKRSIIDGQQRLTSLTLLLIYLNNLQKDRPDNVKFDELIFSEKYAKKSFNLQVEDREECIDALYNAGDFDASNSGESVKNVVERYHDIEEIFPPEIKENTLPYFIDWLIDNVIFVEIITYSDDDAYTIFETMNDRGLNLTSAEMLKGYLISNLGTNEEKIKMNDHWKTFVLHLKNIEKDEDLEFFKSWLRAKYAESIRQGRKGSENEDFEKIGTRFHSWVRDNKSKIGLKTKTDYYKFINDNFTFYARLYFEINNASVEIQKGLASIFYIDERKFPKSFYYPMLMAPVKLTDDEATIHKKIALVARFIESFIVNRSVNSRTLGYSAIRYTMFSLVKDVRDKDVPELATILKKKVQEFEENFDGIQSLELHHQNKRFIHFLLARITRHIEKASKVSSSFKDYIDPDIDNPFEVEHIWSDIFEEHKDEFEQRDEWESYRNKIGALLLLPKGFNQSFGALSYDKKMPHYYGQNLLAKSLTSKCYDRNPDFLSYKALSGLSFKPHEQFKKQDIIERTQLYQKICEEIWNTDVFDKIANGGT